VGVGVIAGRLLGDSVGSALPQPARAIATETSSAALATERR